MRVQITGLPDSKGNISILESTSNLSFNGIVNLGLDGGMEDEHFPDISYETNGNKDHPKDTRLAPISKLPDRNGQLSTTPKASYQSNELKHKKLSTTSKGVSEGFCPC